jgi:hypothetical protein
MRMRALTSLLVAAALASCGGSDLVLPSASNPADLKVVKGDGQSARVGTALPESLVVQVTDATGRPVVGQAVVFIRDGSSGGAVSPDTVQTNADGRAQAHWVLGSTVGTQMAHAAVPRGGDQALTVFFTATATAAPAPPPSQPPGGGGGGTGGGNNGGGNNGGGGGGGGNQPEPDLQHLTFTVQPSNTESGHRFSPTVQVAVHDASGNVVKSATGEVKIDFGQKPDHNAKLRGDNTERLSSGVATFGDLKVSGEGSGFTLVASLDGVESVESDPFRIED